jgi:hypothetical protein
MKLIHSIRFSFKTCISIIGKQKLIKLKESYFYFSLFIVSIYSIKSENYFKKLFETEFKKFFF